MQHAHYSLMSRHGRVGAPVQTRACAAASSVRLARGERDPPLAAPWREAGRGPLCLIVSLCTIYNILHASLGTAAATDAHSCT